MRLKTISSYLSCLLVSGVLAVLVLGTYKRSDLVPHVLKYSPIVQTLPTYQDSQHCEEAHNIAFVKVHKAGSTTVQNILQRFGYKRNLTFVLSNMSDTSKPPGMRHYLGFEGTINFKSLLPLPKGRKHYNILTNHVVFNESVFRQVMSNSTIYIGIIREPFQQLRSTFAYYGYGSNWKLENNESVVSHYLKSPEKFKVTYLNSRMSYDFGLAQSSVRNKTLVTSFIEELDAIFSFVLILEYFDESLVLLKRILCWSLSDILYIPVNSSKNPISYTLEDVENHKRIAVADYAIYSHFYKKFWSLVKKELASDFDIEVRYFKKLLKKLRLFCESGEAYLTIHKSRWSESFSVKRHDCELMTMHEVTFINLLTKNQYGSK